MHRHDGQGKMVLGLEHPGTLTSVNGLAGALSEQGKYGKAEEHRQTLDLRKKVLGFEHPFAPTSMSNLAWVMGRGA